MSSALKSRFWAVAVLLALAVCTAQAQQKEPQKDPRLNAPLQPITAESSSKPVDTPPAADQGGAKPPLGGAEDYSLFGLGGGRSYLLTSLRFSQGFDTNSGSQPGARQFRAQTQVNGNVTLDRTWNKYNLGLNYSTGGILYSNNTGQNAPVHSLALSGRITGRRASFMLSDSFSLLPESAFGFGGFGGVGNLGGLAGQNPFNYSGSGFGQGSNLSPFFTPNQSILTTRGKRIANTIAGQIQYNLSARNSLVGSASYGILRFLEGSFIETDNITGKVTFSRKMTAEDSLGVSYIVGRINFLGIDRNMTNHSAHMVYGRRLTGRLALSVSAGPQISVFHNSLTGDGKRVNWSMRSSLKYQMATSDLAFGYARRSTGGSGVLVGADSDNFDVTYSKQITRMWDMGLTTGYAHNSSLRQLTTGPVGQKFNTWRGGLSLSRPMGRSMRLFMNYNAQWQNNNNCAVTGTCTPTLTRHHFALGFSWQSNPINLE